MDVTMCGVFLNANGIVVTYDFFRVKPFNRIMENTRLVRFPHLFIYLYIYLNCK